MTRRTSTRRGFGVMETLIAVAILGVGLAAVLGLRQSMVRQMAAAEALERWQTDRRNALALVHDVNPMLEPDGERALDARRVVRWRSERLTPPRPNAAYPSGQGRFVVALFRLDVSIVDGDDDRAAFAIERLGWVDAVDAPITRGARLDVAPRATPRR